MKTVLFALLLIHIVFSASAKPSGARRTREDLRTRLVTALCALKGQVTPQCLHDIRLNNEVDDVILSSGVLYSPLDRGVPVGLNHGGMAEEEKRSKEDKEPFFNNW